MRLVHSLLAVWTACGFVFGCGSSAPTSPASTPTAPVNSTPAFNTIAGVWHGYLNAISCYISCEPAQLRSFVLRAGPDGPGYTGMLDISGSSPRMLTFRGLAQADGSVLFSGTYTSSDSSYTIDLRRLLVKVDASAGLLGEIDLRKVYKDGSSLIVTGSIVSASFQPFVSLPGQSLSGDWEGEGVIRACSKCLRYRTDPGRRVGLSASLVQSGGTITGQLRLDSFQCGGCWIPVTGIVSGSTVSLSSDVVTVRPVSLDRSLHLETFNGTIDAIGGIRGNFAFASDTQDYDYSKHAYVDASYRYECEIVWLTRK